MCCYSLEKISSNHLFPHFNMMTKIIMDYNKAFCTLSLKPEKAYYVSSRKKVMVSTSFLFTQLVISLIFEGH